MRQPTAGTVDFVHRTFQDYLGAKAAIEAHDFPLLVNNAHDDQWEDVVRMAVAHARPAESADLLRRLVDRGDAEGEHRGRLHLLAAASLQYATEIEPGVRGLVEQRARVLMPPRSPEEATALAALGPGILDLLPGPPGLEHDEVGPVIQTAATIGGDHAYAFLSRFAQSLTSESASYELVDGWKNFDSVPYARDILLPNRDRLHLAVSSQDQRNALRLLEPITDVTFREALTAEEIIEHLSPEHTHTLNIYSGQALADLKFVRQLPALNKLTLSECNQLTHIDELVGLPLSELSLLRFPSGASFDALDSLPELTELALYTPLPWGSLEHMPAPLDLTALRLARWIDIPLRGISKWQLLKILVINAGPTPAEWREISSLRHLTALFISEYDLAQAAPMPNVTFLHLSPDADAQLHLVPDIFPKLKGVFVNYPASQPVTTDITPLKRIEGLHVSLHYADSIVGLEEFDPETVHLYPRPRTAGT